MDSVPGATLLGGHVPRRVERGFPPRPGNSMLSLPPQGSRDTDSGPGMTRPFWSVSHIVCCGFPPRRGGANVSWLLQDSRDMDSGPRATLLGGRAPHRVERGFPPRPGNSIVFWLRRGSRDTDSGFGAEHVFVSGNNPTPGECLGDVCPASAGFGRGFTRVCLWKTTGLGTLKSGQGTRHKDEGNFPDLQYFRWIFPIKLWTVNGRLITCR